VNLPKENLPMTPRRVIAVLALAWVLLPCAPERADDAEDRAVAVITKARGSITRDLRAKAKPVIGVNLTNVKDADAVMKELKEFKNLQKLNLTTTDVTDVGLKELRELNSLQSLDL